MSDSGDDGCWRAVGGGGRGGSRPAPRSPTGEGEGQEEASPTRLAMEKAEAREDSCGLETG